MKNPARLVPVSLTDRQWSRVMAILESEQNGQANTAKCTPYDFWKKLCLERADFIRVIRKSIKEQRQLQALK